MLVQYVRKTQAAHRPHKYSSGEAGLIFTDGLAPSKSLPFPAPLLLPTHHLPGLFRSQAFWGSRLSCLVFWGYSYESSMVLNWFQQELHVAQSWCKVEVRNGVSRELSSKKGQIVRETRACFGCKGPWSEVFVEEKRCWLCSVTHLSVCTWKFNSVSTGLHWSSQWWLISRP